MRGASDPLVERKRLEDVVGHSNASSVGYLPLSLAVDQKAGVLQVVVGRFLGRSSPADAPTRERLFLVGFALGIPASCVVIETFVALAPFAIPHPLSFLVASRAAFSVVSRWCRFPPLTLGRLARMHRATADHGVDRAASTW